MFIITTVQDSHYSKKPKTSKSALFWSAIQAKRRQNRVYDTKQDVIEQVLRPAFVFAGFKRDVDPLPRWFNHFVACGTIQELE